MPVNINMIAWYRSIGAVLKHKNLCTVFLLKYGDEAKVRLGTNSSYLWYLRYSPAEHDSTESKSMEIFWSANFGDCS